MESGVSEGGLVEADLRSTEPVTHQARHCAPTIQSSVRERKTLSAFFQKQAINMQTAALSNTDCKLGEIFLKFGSNTPANLLIGS